MRRYRIVDASDPGPDVVTWMRVKLGVSGPPEDPGREDATRTIAEVLQCEHILVLCGLGTSLCIADPVDPTATLFPTMSGLWNKVSARVGAEMFAKVSAAVEAGDSKNIEDLLSRCKMTLALHPEPPEGATPEIQEFVRMAEEVIRGECRKLPTPDATIDHEEFLRRLVRRGPRRPRANLFTTNYDLCFEIAASRIGLPVIDGFTFSAPPQFTPEVFDYDIVTNSSYSKEPDFVPRLLRLFKLHGSVDWHAEGGIITKRSDTASPSLIYPQVGKYQSSYSPPFLEIMSRFQGLLRQRSVGVLAICCGFNDQHIAEPVLSCIKSNASLRMVVCAPDLCEYDAKKRFGDAASAAIVANPILRQMDHLISNGDTRLAFVNASLPDVVKLMPSISARTDAEEHEARIKKLEKEMASIKASPKGST